MRAEEIVGSASHHKKHSKHPKQKHHHHDKNGPSLEHDHQSEGKQLKSISTEKSSGYNYKPSGKPLEAGIHPTYPSPKRKSKEPSQRMNGVGYSSPKKTNIHPFFSI